jgi:hypothetical protein
MGESYERKKLQNLKALYSSTCELIKPVNQEFFYITAQNHKAVNLLNFSSSSNPG